MIGQNSRDYTLNFIFLGPEDDPTTIETVNGPDKDKIH